MRSNVGRLLLPWVKDPFDFSFTILIVLPMGDNISLFFKSAYLLLSILDSRIDMVDCFLVALLRGWIIGNALYLFVPQLFHQSLQMLLCLSQCFVISVPSSPIANLPDAAHETSCMHVLVVPVIKGSPVIHKIRVIVAGIRSFGGIVVCSGCLRQIAC